MPLRHAINTVIDLWDRKNIPGKAAGLAFYLVISIVPMFVILVSTTRLILPDSAEQIRPIMERFLGAASWVIHPGMDALKVSILNVVVFAILLYSSSNFFSYLQRALNDIWDLEPVHHVLFWKRIKAILLILGLALLMIVLIVASSLLQTVGEAFFGWIEMPGWVVHVIFNLFSVLLTTGIVGYLFFRVPVHNLGRMATWIGSLVTSLLLLLGNTVIGIYFAHARMPGLYGPFGQTLILMLWAYYTVHVFLVGAILTRLIAERTKATDPH